MEIERMSHAGVDYLARTCTNDEEYDVAASVVMQAMKEGLGLCPSQYESRESLLAEMKTYPVYQVFREEDMQFCSLLLVNPCILLRSNKTLYGGGIVVVVSEIRGKGVGLAMGKLGMYLSRKHGYPTTVSRIALVSRFLHPVVTIGKSLYGTIPNSMNLPKFGWVDDLIITHWDPSFARDDPLPKETCEIAPLNRDPGMAISVNVPWQSTSPHLPHLLWKGNKLSVQSPTMDEVIQVEEMFRDAAKEGRGFAMDEFNADGYLTRHLFHKSHMAVIKSLQDGAIKAGLIFGPAGACRDVNTSQVNCYMVVEKSERGKGLGSALLDYGLGNMEAFKYSGVLTDVFVTCESMLRMLHRRGFLMTASIPNSGVVKGNGRTNTMLMYKPIRNIKSMFSKL